MAIIGSIETVRYQQGGLLTVERPLFYTEWRNSRNVGWIAPYNAILRAITFNNDIVHADFFLKFWVNSIHIPAQDREYQGFNSVVETGDEAGGPLSPVMTVNAGQRVGLTGGFIVTRGHHPLNVIVTLMWEYTSDTQQFIKTVVNTEGH